MLVAECFAGLVGGGQATDAGAQNDDMCHDVLSLFMTIGSIRKRIDAEYIDCSSAGREKQGLVYKKHSFDDRVDFKPMNNR
jgi:hypothetical protein